MKALLDDPNALELQVALIYVVEFQKRGLPYGHCLAILGDKSSVEISDLQNAEPYETLMNCKAHHYPKAFCKQTLRANSGNPLCRRRYNGRTVTVKKVVLDNYGLAM
uniref:Uncharacterized protein n=1 Tax=Anopheles dirus TaxID=7168 RepID=A0A182NN27_9DIPT